jgi:RNA polymerase sigma-70 factor, ECF subfamily
VDPTSRRRLTQDLTRLADGDREAFSPVFVALLPLLRRFACRSLPHAEAEDAAQEALVKVFLRATEFDPSRDALSWALGIAAYEVKTTRKRRERRRESADDVAAREDPAPSPEEDAIAADLDAAIDTALRGLAAGDAATLRAFAAGEPPADVAPATFRKRVERALRRLRARWRATHDDGR